VVDRDVEGSHQRSIQRDKRLHQLTGVSADREDVLLEDVAEDGQAIALEEI
jgi:hypothetical protein